MADKQQSPQGPVINFGAPAEAHRVLTIRNQAFADNPIALTPDGALLLQEIRNLRTQTNERFNRLDQRFDCLDQRLDRTEQRGHIHRLNTDAKLENRFVRQKDYLVPLFSYKDYGGIPNFPATPADITRLTSQALNAILEALEATTNETIQEREYCLKRVIQLHF